MRPQDKKMADMHMTFQLLNLPKLYFIGNVPSHLMENKISLIWVMFWHRNRGQIVTRTDVDPVHRRTYVPPCINELKINGPRVCALSMIFI